MDITYFQKINNTFNSSSKQETDLYLLNRHVNRQFSDSIDYHKVLRNGNEFDLIIQRYAEQKNKKKIKSRPGQFVNMGDLIEWQGHKWIVISIDPDDKTYLSAIMVLCNIVLNWQNTSGEIITIDCYAENQTKYSSGIDENKVLQMGDFQYGITLPLNEDTKILKRDKRFVVDLMGLETPDVYILTNREVMLNNYSYFDRGGTISLTLSYDAFSKENDKLVNDGTGNKVWICDYKEPNIQPSPTDPDDDGIIGTITCKGDMVLIAGGNTKTFSIEFKDASDNIVEFSNYEWSVVIDENIKKYITVSISDDNKCKIKVSYADSIIGNSIVLNVINNDSNKVIATTKVYIEGGI